MKKSDFKLLLVVIGTLAIFKFVPNVYEAYKDFNHLHGVVLSFVKFALLATLGESIGLRIVSGKYNKQGFGLIPRALVWGCLGVFIKFSFIVFITGTPNLLHYLGFPIDGTIMKGDFSVLKLLGSFSISVLLNTIFAPVMMTLHKITDGHITNTGGTLSGFFTKIKVVEIVKNMNWSVMINFVFKKTIPFFWISAHTITFLLPADFQILFAALLGVVLGVILAFASLSSKK